MSEMFSRRSFLKGSAALVGASALMTLTGCDGGSKHTINIDGFTESPFEPDIQDPDDFPDLGASGNPGSGGINTTNFYSVGGGIKMRGSIGIAFIRPKKSIAEASGGSIAHAFYPFLTLHLQNTTSSPVTIRTEHFKDAYFNGKPVAIKGLKLSATGFEQTLIVPPSAENSTSLVRLFLDAPCDSKEYQNQPVSFTFSVNGIQRVRCSGKFSEAPIFTITY